MAYLVNKDLKGLMEIPEIEEKMAFLVLRVHKVHREETV